MPAKPSLKSKAGSTRIHGGPASTGNRALKSVFARFPGCGRSFFCSNRNRSMNQACGGYASRSLLSLITSIATRPSGSIPLLGDDDGGRLLAIASGDYRFYRDGLCTGSVLFGRGDFKFQAAGFCEESLWLLGDDAWPIFNSLGAQAPLELRRSFN